MKQSNTVTGGIARIWQGRTSSALANATTARLAAGLPAQPLLPRATDLPEEFRLTIDRVRVDSTYITAGVNISRVEMMHAEIDRGEETVNHRPPEEPEDLDPGILDRLDPLP